jgi:hypothetical protein
MKDQYLISYRLFCSRRKFSLYRFLLQNKEISYEEILDYFRSKSVTPPSIDIFEKTKQKVLDDIAPKVDETIKETIEETKKVEKPKRKRRKRKNE